MASILTFADFAIWVYVVRTAALLAPQREDRVDLGRTSRRQVVGDQSDEAEEQSRTSEDRWIVRADAEEHVRHQP